MRLSHVIVSFFAALGICTSVHSQNSTGANSSMVLPLSLFPSSQNSTLLENTYSPKDDGWDEWKHGRFPALSPESGGVILINYVQLENLLSGLLTLIYGWGDPQPPELMDDGGGKRTASYRSTSTGQSSDSRQRRSRTLLNTLFCCFTGGCGGGDGHDENKGQAHLLAACEASTINDEEQEETSHNTLPNQTLSPQPIAVVATQIEVNIDPPGSEANTPQAGNGYILIGYRVYRSEEDCQDHGLMPGNDQEIVYVYMADVGKYVPALLTNSASVLQCTICMSVLSEAVRLGCNNEHSFCKTCRERLEKNTCPSCNLDFDTTESDRSSQRQVANLPVECPWCQHSSTLSEIADHMKSCEQQPETCAHCNQRFAPEKLDLHLQQCTKELGDIRDMNEEGVRQLVLQLAEALSKAALPQNREQASQWVHFSDGTVLQPVQGSPGLLMQSSADKKQLEFYLRLDFSNTSGRESSLKMTIVDTHYEAGGIPFTFRVKLDFGYFNNRVDLEFAFTGNKDQFPGSWVLAVLDHQGQEILSEPSEHAGWQIDTGEVMIFRGWRQPKDGSRSELLMEESSYWKKEKNHRIMYYRLSFRPWQ